ncbi:MAG: acetate--CoA ligase family protein [Deltaproteobacteria bacterium]|nr:MAG: acetate--CoA ligase family protein [Deltaproteobacteria bacterium]
MSQELRSHQLDLFMAPRSVAVVGASRKTGPGSFNVIENMLEFGFEGEIYPINPLAQEIAGIKSYKDVKEVTAPLDLAIIATPRDHVAGIVADCASVGIKGAIVVPQGFADADDEGKRLQDELSRISKDKGIRIMGPNTLGVMDSFSGFTSSFMPLKREKVPVGVICQSGIFFVGASLFTGMMGKGIDVGNGCDLNFADALAYFAEDDDIKLIFIHIEGMGQGRRFFELAQQVARKKPIIALKTARTHRGAEAAASHSGSFVGQHEIFEAAFRQAGIISASDPQEVIDYTRALLHFSPMRGNRIGLVTFTGAGGIILVDTFQDEGLAVSELSHTTLQKIKDLSPPWMPINNPLDIWPALMKHGMDYVYGLALDEVLRDDQVDGVICIAICPSLPENAYLDATAVIREKAASLAMKPVVAWLYGPNQQAVSSNLEEGGHVLSLPTLPRAARTLAVLYRRGQFLKQKVSSPPKFQFDQKAREILQSGLDEGQQKIDGQTARDLLQCCQIASTKSRFCRDLNQALKAAEDLSYPVALKISSPDITHKTDLGGVALDLDGPEDLEQAWRRMQTTVKEKAHQVHLLGFTVEQMADDGVDTFLGAKRDPQFGPVILFGTGGIYTEIWKDIAYRIAPFGWHEACRMIEETRCYQILKGARGQEAYDLETLTGTLLKLSVFMQEVEAIKEIDINPFRVFVKGGWALDARFVL